MTSRRRPGRSIQRIVSDRKVVRTIGRGDMALATGARITAALDRSLRQARGPAPRRPAVRFQAAQPLHQTGAARVGRDARAMSAGARQRKRGARFCWTRRKGVWLQRTGWPRPRSVWLVRQDAETAVSFADPSTRQQSLRANRLARIPCCTGLRGGVKSWVAHCHSLRA